MNNGIFSINIHLTNENEPIKAIFAHLRNRSDFYVGFPPAGLPYTGGRSKTKNNNLKNKKQNLKTRDTSSKVRSFSLNPFRTAKLTPH